MYNILSFVDRIGSNPRTTIMTRKDLSNSIKNNYGKTGFEILQEAFRKRYIRMGRLYGFVLTKKGLNRYIDLENNRGGERK